MKQFKLLLILLMFIVPTAVIAQDEALPDPGGDVDAPIDGGLSLLVAAGVAYGAKKAHAARQQKKEQEK